MKIIIMGASLLMAGLVVFCGCTKKDNSSNSSGSNYKMTATVSGNSFSGDSCTIELENPTDSEYLVSGGAYSLGGGTIHYPNIGLEIHGYHGAGTYVNVGSSYNLSSDYYSGNGTVTITSATSSAVTGTFNFTAASVGSAGSVTVSNGAFTARP